MMFGKLRCYNINSIKDNILKILIPTVLLPSTMLIGGFWRYKNYHKNSEIDQKDISVASSSHLTPINDNLLIKLHITIDSEKCKFGNNGKVYLVDTIKSINVNNYSRNTVCDNLSTLCKEFKITNSICEYFFTKFSRYDELSPEIKILMAQCVKIMYNNKKNPQWKGIIENSLTILSLHENLCYFRATELINTVHSELSNFLTKQNRGHNKNSNNEAIINKTYSELKRSILVDAYNNCSTKYSGNVEALNVIRTYLQYILGMSEKDPHNHPYYADQLGIDSQNSLDKLMNKKYLIKRLDEIIKDSLTELECDKLFENCAGRQISFEEYCNFSCKTKTEIETLTEAINQSKDKYHDPLKSWIRGKCNLTFDDVDTDNPGIVNLLLDLTGIGNNFGHVGCPELDNRDGFRFLIILFDYKYFDNCR